MGIDGPFGFFSHIDARLARVYDERFLAGRGVPRLVLPEDSPDLAAVFTFECCFILRKRCAQIVPPRNKSCSMKSEKAYYFNDFKYLRSKLIPRRSQVQILAPPPNQIKGLRETVTSCPPMPLYLSRTPSSIPLCRVFSSEAAPALPFPTLRDRDPTSARR